MQTANFKSGVAGSCDEVEPPQPAASSGAPTSVKPAIKIAALRLARLWQ